MRGADSIVTTKVTPAVAASTRSISHSATKVRGLNRLDTAATTTAASTALGTCDSAGVRNSSTSSTKPVAITVAHPVRAPAYSVSAERENEVLVAKAPEKAEASLPAPCPIRSWLASQRLPSRWLSILALEAISSELTSASTSAGASRLENWSQPGQPGQYAAGRPCGSG